LSVLFWDVFRHKNPIKYGYYRVSFEGVLWTLIIVSLNTTFIVKFLLELWQRKSIYGLRGIINMLDNNEKEPLHKNFFVKVGV